MAKVIPLHPDKLLEQLMDSASQAIARLVMQRDQARRERDYYRLLYDNLARSIYERSGKGLSGDDPQ